MEVFLYIYSHHLPNWSLNEYNWQWAIDMGCREDYALGRVYTISLTQPHLVLTSASASSSRAVLVTSPRPEATNSSQFYMPWVWECGYVWNAVNAIGTLYSQYSHMIITCTKIAIGRVVTLHVGMCRVCWVSSTSPRRYCQTRTNSYCTSFRGVTRFVYTLRQSERIHCGYKNSLSPKAEA